MVCMQVKFKRMHGARQNFIPSYLDEFLWRRKRSKMKVFSDPLQAITALHCSIHCHKLSLQQWRYLLDEQSDILHFCILLEMLHFITIYCLFDFALLYFIINFIFLLVLTLDKSHIALASCIS